MNDQELFDALKGTAMGTALVDYLERWTAKLCDVRNITPGADISAILGIVKQLEADVIDRIKLTNPNDEKEINPFL